MKKFQQGFTLIELIIVVAIIGILASVAMPTYQSYTVRAQVSEGLNLTGPLQSAIAEYYNDYGAYPTDNGDAGLDAATNYSGKYVDGISVNGAVISIQYGKDANAQINGETVTLTAAPNLGSMNWDCASGGVIPDTLLPQVCR
ncbi:MAG: pilin [Gammaproteobacteria bacterium]|nr:pilin [Gammaproteobacteria bacterium]